MLLRSRTSCNTNMLPSWWPATTTTTRKRYIHASALYLQYNDNDGARNNNNNSNNSASEKSAPVAAATMPASNEHETGSQQQQQQQQLKKADNLMAKASASFDREDYANALTLYQEVLQLRTAALGAEHPDVGEAHHLVGETLWTLSQFKEAEAALTRSLVVLRKNLGPKHKAVGTILKNIAECRQAYVDEHDTLSKAKATQLLEQVLPLARDACEIAQAHATAAGAAGDDDEDYLDALYGLGELYLQLDRYAEALPCFEKNLPHIERTQSADSMDALLCWRNLAACYKAVGDRAKWEHADSLRCFVSPKKRGASSIMREKWRKKRMRRLKRKRRAQKK